MTGRCNVGPPCEMTMHISKSGSLCVNYLAYTVDLFVNVGLLDRLVTDRYNAFSDVGNCASVNMDACHYDLMASACKIYYKDCVNVDQPTCKASVGRANECLADVQQGLNGTGCRLAVESIDPDLCTTSMTSASPSTSSTIGIDWIQWTCLVLFIQIFVG